MESNTNNGVHVLQWYIAGVVVISLNTWGAVLGLVWKRRGVGPRASLPHGETPARSDPRARSPLWAAPSPAAFGRPNPAACSPTSQQTRAASKLHCRHEFISSKRL